MQLQGQVWWHYALWCCILAVPLLANRPSCLGASWYMHAGNVPKFDFSILFNHLFEGDRQLKVAVLFPNCDIIQIRIHL